MSRIIDEMIESAKDLHSAGLMTDKRLSEIKSIVFSDLEVGSDVVIYADTRGGKNYTEAKVCSIDKLFIRVRYGINGYEENFLLTGAKSVTVSVPRIISTEADYTAYEKYKEKIYLNILRERIISQVRVASIDNLKIIDELLKQYKETSYGKRPI